MANASASEFLEFLRCPGTNEPLVARGVELTTESGGTTFRLTPSGIPLFAEHFCSDDARVQQAHYDKVANEYLRNLQYPHTQEYMGYLDREFLRIVGRYPLGDVAEICCGRGEAFDLVKDKVRKGVGIDVSVSMLEAARRAHPENNLLFVQGDATLLPLASESFDSAFMLGGIHHVNDRQALFDEVFRILRPGGRFFWREPVSDFFLWQALRAVIYKVSPALDADTERPLLYDETVPPLHKAGFDVRTWETFGFLGYCVLMNSDVLVFNRLFRYLPGVRGLTRFAVRVDHWITTRQPLARSGLIVMGVAEKKAREMNK